MTIVLVADPSLDLSQTTSLLQDAGVAVSANAPLNSASTVLVCVSCCDGPMSDTLSALEAHVGSRISSCGILLTDMAAISDEDDLVDLVTIETQELLNRMTQTGDVLFPCLREDDPDLVDRIRTLPDAFPGGIALQAPREALPKPWWKFW